METIENRLLLLGQFAHQVEEWAQGDSDPGSHSGQREEEGESGRKHLGGHSPQPSWQAGTEV